jgi:hypothetical protein
MAGYAYLQFISHYNRRIRLWTDPVLPCKGPRFNAKNRSIFSPKSANFLKKNVVFLPCLFAKQAI